MTGRRGRLGLDSTSFSLYVVYIPVNPVLKDGQDGPFMSSSSISIKSGQLKDDYEGLCAMKSLLYVHKESRHQSGFKQDPMRSWDAKCSAKSKMNLIKGLHL